MVARKQSGSPGGPSGTFRLGMLGAAGLVLAALAPAVAQHTVPPTTGEVKIETYSGLRRTDTASAGYNGPSSRVTNLPATDAPDAGRADSTLNASTGSAAAPPPITRGTADTKDPVKPTPMSTGPIITPKTEDTQPEPLPLVPSERETPAAPKPLDKAVVPASVTGPDLAPRPDAPAVEPKSVPAVKPPTPAESDPEPKRAATTELSENDLYKLALWQLISTTTALVLGLFLLTGLAFQVLRRFGARTGPLFCVEFTGPAAMPLGYSAAPPTAVPPAPESTTAQPFEIGPTYEEELQLRAEAQQQQDAAVLQQILEDNVHLRDLLDMADADGTVIAGKNLEPAAA